MGLGIAIGGGIILTVLVTLVVTTTMTANEHVKVQESMHESFGLINKFQKTDFVFNDTSAERGLSGVSFGLNNTGLEKFWNYEDSNLIVTYEALIGGVKTNVTETQSYFSGSNISMDCDGSNGGDIPPGTWSISQITVDVLDPGLLNSDETAEVVTQLSYPLSNTISTISMTFASDIGKTTTVSFETSSNCVL